MKLLFAVLCACLLGGASRAQNSDSNFNLSLHAHDHVTAADIGLPQYPGSVVSKDEHNSSDSADLGFAFGDTAFTLRVVSYKSADSQDAVLAFYRRAMARYGEVLECDHGKPVGGVDRTRTGLTCADQNGNNNFSVNSSNDDRELRVGTPKKMRVMGVEPKAGKTRFSLAYVELPKDTK